MFRMLLVCAALLLPCAGAAEPVNKIVAIVNDAPITLLEVERETRRLLEAGADLDDADARQKALDDLIDRQLQLQRARQLGIVISDDAVDQRLRALQDELGLSSEAALKGLAEERFLLSYPQFRKRVREDMQIQGLFYREVFSRTETYEDEVDQFLKQEGGMGKLREYHLRHILLTVAADGGDADAVRAVALSLRQQAQDGAEFAALARAHSDGDQASIGGNLGFRSEGELPSAFVVEVQNMVDGEISEPIQTSRGFHLLKLEQVRGGDLREKIRRYHLYHVFLDKDAQTQAQDIWRSIQSRDDFIGAVRQHSLDDISIEKDGEIGWFDEQDIPDYFTETVAKMQQGEISAPVQSPFGWHILYLAEVDVDRFNIQRLREQAREILRERRALAQRDIWLRRLRSDASVRILDPSFSTTIR